MGIERDVERMLRGESAEPSFLNDLSQKTYLINADYEHYVKTIVSIIVISTFFIAWLYCYAV